MNGSWRDLVEENLEVLSKCTVVSSEMAILLIKYKLITVSEKDKLMNPTITDHERATILYVGILRKWGDKDFERFKETLKEGRNTRASEILHTGEKVKHEVELSLGPQRELACEVTKLQQELSQLEGKLAELKMSTEYQKLAVEDTYRLVRRLDTETSARLSSLEESDESSRSVPVQEHLSAVISRLAEVERNEEALVEKLMTLEAEKREITVEMTQQKDNSRLEAAKLKEGQDRITALERRLRTVERKERDTQEKLTKTEAALKVFLLAQNNTANDSNVSSPTLKSRAIRYFQEVREAMQVILDDHFAFEWNIDGQNKFKLKQTMGRWFLIEETHRCQFARIPLKSSEFNLSLSGTTIQFTQRWRETRMVCVDNWNCSVDIQSPHHWKQTGNGIAYTWLKTQYDNWGILITSTDDTSYDVFWILSRKRTLPVATLEMLRNIADERGFPVANRHIIEHFTPTNNNIHRHTRDPR